MKIDFNLTKDQSFQAKVSPKFINSMRGFINNRDNRIKNHYKLDQKIKEYATFGYNDYTIEMHQRFGPLGTEYRLIAVKDGDTRNRIVLTKPLTAYRKIFNRFMNFNFHDFNSIMSSKTK